MNLTLTSNPKRSYPSSSSSWAGSIHSLSFSSRNSFTKDVWRVINFKNAPTSRREMCGVIRAEMFGQLTTGLEAAWNKLRGEEILTKENIVEPMRDIRRALLEADVSLPVVRRFIQSVSDQAVGTGLIRGVRPDQQMVKPVEQSNIVKESGISVQSPISTPTSERIGSSISEQLLTTGDTLDKYQVISEKLENLVSDAKEAEIQSVISEVPSIILKCFSRDEATLAVAQKVFKRLYENASNIVHVNTHLAILAAIRDVSKLIVKDLTCWLTYYDEERKFNKEITVGLIRSELLNLAEYNVHLAKLLDAGRNKPATEFAISLVQTLVMSDSRVIPELQNLVDALAKLAARPGSPEYLRQLVEMAKNPSVSAAALSGLTSVKEESIKQSKDKKAAVLLPAARDDTGSESVEPDPAGFREQVSMLFAEWYRICELPGAIEFVNAHYVIQLHQSGLLKGDDASDRLHSLALFCCHGLS